MLVRLASEVSEHPTTCGQRFGIRRYSLIRERYAKGCFKASLASDIDVMCCRDHKREDILGRLSNNTLELSEDSKGLRFNVRLNPDDPQAVRIFAQVNRQDIKGASTRFMVK